MKPKVGDKFKFNEKLGFEFLAHIGCSINKVYIIDRILNDRLYFNRESNLGRTYCFLPEVVILSNTKKHKLPSWF